MARRQHHRRQHRALSPAFLVTALAVLTCQPLQAQEARVSAGAASNARLAFNIPAQDLNQAVLAFAQHAGVRVFYDTARLRGLRSGAVSGELTRGEALSRLLAGTGLAYRFTGASSVTILAPDATASGSAEGAILLDTLQVESDGTIGFVATRTDVGTKTNTPLIETPQSVSVVTRDQVETQGAQNVVEALRYTPGVIAEVRGSATRYDMPYIRGFGSPTDPILFLDGLRLSRGSGYAIPQIDPYLLERIEVLKGPSSMLYGASTPGGFVNMVSKRPTEETIREIVVGIGSFDYYKTAFDLGGAADPEGKLLYRLAGVAYTGNTQVDFTEEQRVSIAPSLAWRPNDDTTLVVLANYQRDPEGGYYGVLPTVGTVSPNPNGQIPRNFFEGDPNFSEFDREQASIGYEFAHRFNDTWSFQQNLRYTHLGVSTESLSTASLATNLSTINRYALATDETLDGLALDNRLEAQFATGPIAHKMIFGLDYQYMDWSQVQNYGAAASINYLHPVYGLARPTNLYTLSDQNQTISQTGLYAQDQLRLGNWLLTAGGRYDWVDISTTSHLTGTVTDQNDSAFSGRVGLTYLWENGVAPYATFSTSFLPVAGTSSTGEAFQPTTGEQYELGIKYQPAGYNAMFTAAVFEITQQNVTTYASPTLRYQTGEVRSRGLELEAKASLSEELNVVASLTLLDATITRSLSADLGQSPVAVPDVMASLWADYTLRDGPLQGFGIGGGVRYVGSSVGGYVPAVTNPSAVPFEVPAYTLVDAMMKYDLKGLSPRFTGAELQVNASNIFDATYYTCQAYNFCNYGKARTVLATLRYRW
ncbi:MULTISPECIES: TonB-dependent siderophore receptor [unclassified Xanthobacter]|uniref:TonB-dependent siderophore receptor n=1 Tax=unclassified Xanthobacter TaxID=2623496 RepID=UPI001EDEE497|nr:MULTISPECIES: TonB-dependent siderophore receptor [unclassified Xanthobacter]